MAEDVFGGMNIVTGRWESVAIWEKMRDLLTLAVHVTKLAPWFQRIPFPKQVRKRIHLGRDSGMGQLLKLFFNSQWANLAAAVNCGESVCTIGICYVVNKIILPSNFKIWRRGGTDHIDTGYSWQGPQALE
jgi:hypothetical protein